MEAVYAIISQLGATLGDPLGPAQPLDGGITNRNFRVRMTTGEYVVRLHGKRTSLLAIDREAERLANTAAAGLGIAPEVAASGPDWLITRYLPAVPIDADRLRADPAPVARALRAIHDSGLQLPVRFWVPELLERYAATVREQGGELPGVYGEAQALVGRIESVLPLSDPVACHNDLLRANLLSVPGAGIGEASTAVVLEPRLALVDWEYAGMGHRLFDLGNLAVNNEFDGAAESRLLEAYFGAPPGPERHAALALMRLMSDAREAAWGVVQSVASELDFDFAGYADEHFERLSRAAADPRLEQWLRTASA
jgi:thiamine kinase-like enzyme